MEDDVARVHDIKEHTTQPLVQNKDRLSGSVNTATTAIFVRQFEEMSMHDQWEDSQRG